MTYKAMEIKLPEVKDLDIDKILVDYTVDIKKPFKYPPQLLSIIEGEKKFHIMHRGSFSAIKGQSKGRKTTLMSMASAAFCNQNNPVLMTFQANIYQDELCIYFDTEQADYECHRFVNIIHKLAGNLDNFIMLRLRPFSPEERFEIIQKVIEKYKDRIVIVIIDGVLDLVSEMNSERESTEITTWLLKVTELLNIHITVIIHENWGTEKASGHIGSSILRRAETVISVNLHKKDKNFSVVKCDRMRGKWFESFIIGINHEDMPFILVTEQTKTKNKSEDPPF